ncbi:hypothetical protein CDAR_591921 [Caerostris darwini]|uniref:Uncharacterized protein n=1 Tax=Caerostris darwini TaxID=1538125 RepID=A0AAV4UWV8_9ARAC|nr:hypothetical protein CDAR_591921 [Caerostris darwini]
MDWNLNHNPHLPNDIFLKEGSADQEKSTARINSSSANSSSFPAELRATPPRSSPASKQSDCPCCSTATPRTIVWHDAKGAPPL